MTPRRKVLAASVLFLVAVFSSCGGGGSDGSPPPPQSFTVSISPNTSLTNPLGVIIATPGNSISVSVVGQNGFSGSVSLSLSGMLAGINVTPSTWQQRPNQTQVVTFTATPTALSGAATLSLKAVSGSLSDNASVFLNIDSFFTQDVDANGGVVSVTDPTSPLFGVTLEIPPGALSSTTHIGLNPEPNAPGIGGILSGFAVDVRPTGLQLNLPAYLSIPYADADNDGLVDDPKSNGVDAAFLQMYGYDPTDHAWTHVSGIADRTLHKIKAELWHFSLYRWWYQRFPDNSAVTYAFGTLPANRTAGATDAQIKANIYSALDRWQTHLAASGISFSEVALDQSPEITFAWTNQSFVTKIRDDAMDTESFARTTVPESDLMPWMNLTIYFYDDASFTNTEGSQVHYQWTPNISMTDGTLNVQAIALHEIGHALGLEHVCERCGQWTPRAGCPMAVMNSWLDPRQPAVALFGADVQAYRDLYGLIYAESGPTQNVNASALYVVNPIAAGLDTFLAYIRDVNSQAFPIITDIAVPPRQNCTPSWRCEVLYGVSYDTLYVINTAGGANAIGPLGVNDLNSLTFDKNGNLYGVTTSGNLVQINTETGAAMLVGPTGYSSSGDLLFFGYFGHPPLYATMTFGANDVLVTVDPSTGAATRVNSNADLGFDLVYGLASTSTFYLLVKLEVKRMVGLTAHQELIEIDPHNGTATYVRQLTFPAWGGSNAARGRWSSRTLR